MRDLPIINYAMKELTELNLSYMPFIKEGGLFVPTTERFILGDLIDIDLQLPNKEMPLRINGKVVWLTPKSAVHHVIEGVGVQFVGPLAEMVRTELEALLDKSLDVGGYTYGISEIKQGSKI
jgi:type IV pilus assembly protein PilZ